MLPPNFPSVSEYLQAISPLSDQALTAFLDLFEEAKFEKGVYFAQEGKKEHKVGILTEGVIRAFFRNQEGKEYNKTFNIPYAFIGAYSSLVTGNINQINIQTLTDSVILVTDYQKIVQLYDEFPPIERLSRKLSEFYFVIKEKREIEMVTLEAEQRYEIFKQEFPQLDQYIPQYYIASYLGVTPTQLSRIRKKMSSR